MSAGRASLAQRRITLLLGALAALLLAAGVAGAEPAQNGNIRVRFDAKVAPKALPRHEAAPVAVTLGGRVGTTDGSTPPQLRRLEIAINAKGQLDRTGLPSCRLQDIQPASTENALRACGQAKVGKGSFSADVRIPEQSPFPSAGKMTAFNGTEDGHPVIFAHVYGTDPVPTSFTLPLRISRAKGRFGTVLSASLPGVTSEVAVVKGISLTLQRRYRYRGERRSYLSATCPAPKGFPGALYPLARVRFSFEGGPSVGSTIVRSCRVRG